MVTCVHIELLAFISKLMKKFFKGCLISVVLIFIVLVIILNLIFKPNKVEFSDKPLDKSMIERNIEFPGNNLRMEIINSKKENIIYQALIIDEELDKDVIFKILIKTTEGINFENKFPLNSSQVEVINKEIAFNSVNKTHFNTRLRLSKNEEISSDRTIKIYSNSDPSKLEMNLSNGSYSVTNNELDKEGYIKDIYLYDKSNNYLYFERHRYFAFQ